MSPKTSKLFTEAVKMLNDYKMPKPNYLYWNGKWRKANKTNVRTFIKECNAYETNTAKKEIKDKV